MKKATKKEVAKFLTPEEQKALQTAAGAVWEYIGGDCLQALAEEGKSTMPRAHVIEVSLDAGRTKKEIERTIRRFESNPSVHEEELKALRSLKEKLDRTYNDPNQVPYAVLIAAVFPAFPYSHYGM